MERPKMRAILEPPDGRARDYSSLIRDANSFNGRLLAERVGRLPFIDNQTGIAQNDCNLWRCERDRVRCQVQTSGLNESRLYNYPNQVGRNRPQLGATRSKGPPNCATLARSSPLALCGLEVAHKERVGLVRAAALTTAATTTMNHRDQQRPPRADSTGSHSFADSDSRDHLSTGTSQSVESPRSQLLDDEQPLSHLNACYLTIGSEVKSPTKGHSLEHEEGLGASIGSDSYQVMKRSKLSKGRNMGSSLIKSVEQSLLIKSNKAKKANGRKLTQNNRGEIMTATNKSSAQKKSASSRLKQTTREARPYVCPICDQTYKTRPGLSYHFIHSHDTILPRNLPVKINSEKPKTKSKQINGSKTDDWEPRAKRPARTRTGQEEPTTRVLRRGRKVAEQEDTQLVQTETHSDEPLLEQISARSLGESTKAQEDGPNETSNLDSKFQEANELQNTDEAKLGGNHCAAGGEGGNDDDDSDDNETVIEMSLSQMSPTKEILNESLSAIQDESSKKWQLEGDKGINHDDEAQADMQPSNADQTGSPKEQSKVNKRRNIFCDFCLGTVDKNRRTCLPEELISCSNCGSSGHPSCLRFSENICRSVKKYSWQCLECKTCSTCNQADHEDQMLFCDDCDRSYHTYCLSPRLEHPPEGSWTCRECLDEYHNDGRK